MNYFKKDGGFGGDRGGNRGGFGKPSFGGRSGFGGRGGGGRPQGGGFGDKQMFEATCADCGKRCEVPFRPNGQKPVYCRDCFAKPENAPSGNFEKRDFGNKRDFSRDDRAPRMAQTDNRSGDSRIDDIKRQLVSMNAKIDQMLEIARQGGMSPVRPVAEKAVAPSKPTVSSKSTAPKSAKKKTSSSKKK